MKIYDENNMEIASPDLDKGYPTEARHPTKSASGKSAI